MSCRRSARIEQGHDRIDRLRAPHDMKTKTIPSDCCQSTGVAFVVVDLAQHGGLLEKISRLHHCG